MAELKTKENNSDVEAFIVAATETEQRRVDCIELLKLMENGLVLNQKCGVVQSLALANTTTSQNAANKKEIGHWLDFRLAKLPFLCTSIPAVQDKSSCLQI